MASSDHILCRVFARRSALAVALFAGVTAAGCALPPPRAAVAPAVASAPTPAWTGQVTAVTSVDGATYLDLSWQGQAPEPGAIVQVRRGERLVGTALITDLPTPERAVARLAGLSDHALPIVVGDAVRLGALDLASPAAEVFHPTNDSTSNTDLAQAHAEVERLRADAAQRQAAATKQEQQLAQEIVARTTLEEQLQTAQEQLALRPAPAAPADVEALHAAQVAAAEAAKTLAERDRDLAVLQVETEALRVEVEAAHTALAERDAAKQALAQIQTRVASIERARLDAEREWYALAARVLRLDGSAAAGTALKDSVRRSFDAISSESAPLELHHAESTP